MAGVDEVMGKPMAHYGTDDGTVPLCEYGVGVKRGLPCKKPEDMAGMQWCPECQAFLIKHYGHGLPEPPELEPKELPAVGAMTNEGEVRAIVDGEQIVLRGKGNYYKVRHRYYWDKGLLQSE